MFPLDTCTIVRSPANSDQSKEISMISMKSISIQFSSFEWEKEGGGIGGKLANFNLLYLLLHSMRFDRLGCVECD